MKKKPLVKFHFMHSVALRRRNQLKLFISSVFAREKTPFKELNVIFCSDDFLLGLNNQFLGHNYLTDILSFPLSDSGQPLEGELYISVERVSDNAGSLKHSLQSELHRVIFHGILHFCGYKDKTRAQIKAIRLREDYYLKKWFAGSL